MWLTTPGWEVCKQEVRQDVCLPPVEQKQEVGSLVGFAFIGTQLNFICGHSLEILGMDLAAVHPPG